MEYLIMKIKALIGAEDGQTLSEYAFLLLLIALAVILVLGTLGQTLVTAFTDFINTAFP